MKKIKLTQNQFAIVDDSDYKYLNQWKWQAMKHGRTYYARRADSSVLGKRILMHREIMKAGKREMLDHINGNGFDNRKCNLRFCTHSQNNSNKRKIKNGTSKYLGVYKHKIGNRWVAAIDKNYNHVYIGLFKTEENAAIAYNIFAEKYHGEFARYNKPI